MRVQALPLERMDASSCHRFHLWSLTRQTPFAGSAQNSGSQPKGQTLPDAPAPNNPPSGVVEPPGAPPPAPSQTTPDPGDLSVETQSHGATEGSSNTTPPPMPPIKTVPAQAVFRPRRIPVKKRSYKYVVNTNFVVVPVTVKTLRAPRRRAAAERFLHLRRQ